MPSDFKKCTSHGGLYSHDDSDNEVNGSDDDDENCANVAKVLMNADRGGGTL